MRRNPSMMTSFFLPKNLQENVYGRFVKVVFSQHYHYKFPLFTFHLLLGVLPSLFIIQ